MGLYLVSRKDKEGLTSKAYRAESFNEAFEIARGDGFTDDFSQVAGVKIGNNSLGNLVQEKNLQYIN